MSLQHVAQMLQRVLGALVEKLYEKPYAAALRDEIKQLRSSEFGMPRPARR